MVTCTNSGRPPAPGLTSTQSERQSYIVTNGQSVSLSWCQLPIWDHDQIFITDSCAYVVVGRPL
jgi:hypothetical protein